MVTTDFNLSLISSEPKESRLLGDLGIGMSARIVDVRSRSPIAHRLMEMGLLRGARVTVRKVAPLGDPLEIEVRGYALSLRRAEARWFVVRPEK